MVNVTVFGSMEPVKKLAKKGTESDLLLYNIKEKRDYAFVAPNTDKVQAKLFSAAMGDFAIVVVPESGLDADLGESLLVLECFGLDGMVLCQPGFEENVKAITKGMAVGKYPVISVSEFTLEALAKIPEKPTTGIPRVPIDHFFDVKSVGTVVLGISRGGEVRRYDKLFLEPDGREVTVRSIQIHDEDKEVAPAGSRVGLAIKGADLGELDRGMVLAKEHLPTTDSLEFEFHQLKFAPPLEKMQDVMVNIGLQFVPGEVTGIGSKVTVNLDKKMVIDGRVVIARPELPKLRIIGWGTV